MYIYIYIDNHWHILALYIGYIFPVTGVSPFLNPAGCRKLKQQAVPFHRYQLANDGILKIGMLSMLLSLQKLQKRGGFSNVNLPLEHHAPAKANKTRKNHHCDHCSSHDKSQYASLQPWYFWHFHWVGKLAFPYWSTWCLESRLES